MIIGINHYCENEQCKVEIYSVTVDEFTNGERNCPSCGRMGRTKGRESQSSRSIGTAPAAGGPVEPVNPHDP